MTFTLLKENEYLTSNNWQSTPVWNRNDPIVPVVLDSMGNITRMANYPEYRCVWARLTPFKAHLQYITYHRGRSAANFEFGDPLSGTTYPIPLVEFDYILKNFSLELGLTEEIMWTATKKGSNYYLGVLK